MRRANRAEEDASAVREPTGGIGRLQDLNFGYFRSRVVSMRVGGLTDQKTMAQMKILSSAKRFQVLTGLHC